MDLGTLLQAWKTEAEKKNRSKICSLLKTSREKGIDRKEKFITHNNFALINFLHERESERERAQGPGCVHIVASLEKQR